MSVIAGNLSETLFNQSMDTVHKNDKVAMAFANLKSVNGVNAMQSQDDDLKKLMPAFLEQANLSTWYQSNPWQILTDSSKYGVEPLGGKLNLEQPPGYRPGNILQTKTPVAPKPKVEQFRRERFGNTSSPEPSVGNWWLDTTQGKGAIVGIIILALALAYLVFFKDGMGMFPKRKTASV